MSEKNDQSKGKPNTGRTGAQLHRDGSSAQIAADLPDQPRQQDAGTTTTRDTTEAEAYSRANPSPEAEHAANQTTDESLRRRRSHNRG